MNGLWKQCVVVACLAVASGVQAQDKKSIVVDGTQWMNASSSERRAFLVGVGNMIAAETAYAKKTGAAAPPAGALITKAVSELKLPDIEARITRWYEANPDRRSMPVLGVVWQDMVKPRR
jgi:hypothetical protein